jgi:hypothetical protein
MFKSVDNMIIFFVDANNQNMVGIAKMESLPSE